MNLLEEISCDLTKALKAKEIEKVSTLRMLKSAIKNKEIEKGNELSDEEVGQVVAKEVKSREESITEYKKGDRADLVRAEEREIGVLKKYLPEQLSEEEIEKIIDGVIKKTGVSSPADMSKVMGPVMAEMSGKADGAKVAEMVKNKLVK